jgi:glycosyltransferase A (GT-A) superfamily protein (DUF2064 family)
MTALPVTVLVVAKAPVPGMAKTRLAAAVGPTSRRLRGWTPLTRSPPRR